MLACRIKKQLSLHVLIKNVLR